MTHTSHRPDATKWNLCPAMEGKEVLQGAVFITGGAEGEWSAPVPENVIEYFERMRAIYEDTRRRTSQLCQLCHALCVANR